MTVTETPTDSTFAAEWRTWHDRHEAVRADGHGFLAITGLTYGPCGAFLAEMFPTAVRYTGASLAFNLACILGASLAPYVATLLAGKHGVAYVGYYLSAAALLTLIALLLSPRKQD